MLTRLGRQVATAQASTRRIVIGGHLVDQSALYGVLRKINDLGLDLVSVNRIGEEEAK